MTCYAHFYFSSLSDFTTATWRSRFRDSPSTLWLPPNTTTRQWTRTSPSQRVAINLRVPGVSIMETPTILPTPLIPEASWTASLPVSFQRMELKTASQSHPITPWIIYLQLKRYWTWFATLRIMLHPEFRLRPTFKREMCPLMTETSMSTLQLTWMPVQKERLNLRALLTFLLRCLPNVPEQKRVLEYTHLQKSLRITDSQPWFH